MGELNGHSGLYEALCRTQQQCRLPEEAARVASSLRSEFERGGIHLPAAARAALQTEQARAVEAGHAFLASALADTSSASKHLPSCCTPTSTASLLGFPSYAHLATQSLLDGSYGGGLDRYA